MPYAIIQTDIAGAIPDKEDDYCFLNHSCLSSMSFGSPEMAWTGTAAEAMDMIDRIQVQNPTPCMVWRMI